MQNPKVGNEGQRAVFDKLRRFIRQLLREPAMELEVPAEEDVIILSLHGNRLPLDSYGTGIHHLVLLCSALAIHQEYVVTIEEPEVHLHPELQREFLRFIATETKNTYYITTHSNVFLDFRPDVSVYYVRFDGEKSSVEHTQTTERARAVLTDMAYKASDLLQSNGIIWVEGPSDRVYFNKWLSILGPDLVEGIHYSIAFYGGKVLAHFSCADDPVEDLVQVLRINRNAVVIMDRDGDDETAQLNRNKARILSELGNGSCWVTSGREIENYLPSDLIKRYLSQRYGKAIAVRFGPDAHLDKSIASSIRAEHGPKVRYAQAKVGYARELCALMTEEDLNVLDLEARLKQVVGHIRAWNHMEPATSGICEE
jgi:hypothetical protein